MIVYSNTTPIIALASIGRLDLLSKVFNKVALLSCEGTDFIFPNRGQNNFHGGFLCTTSCLVGNWKNKICLPAKKP